MLEKWYHAGSFFSQSYGTQMTDQPKGIPPKNALTLVIMAGVAVAGVVAAVFSTANAGIILGFVGVVCANLYTSYQNAQEAQDIKQDTREVRDTLIRASDNQKEEVRAVRDTLATTTTNLEQTAARNAEQQNRMEKTGDDTHYLVNGTMGANLFIIAELRKEKAERTKKPVDQEAAVEAQKKYDEHMAQLKVIEDARKQPLEPLAPQEVTIVGQTDAVVVTTEGKKA